MKHIRSAIAASLLVIGSAAVVSAQTAQVPATQQGQARVHKGHRGPAAELLKGLALSDAEKANLKAVHAKYEPQMKALRQQYKPAQGKIAKGDTAAMRARWEQNKPLREAQMKLMESERADLRAALTPANQAKFDANVKRAETRFAKREAKGKAFGGQ